MAYPTPIVEIAFDGTPYDVSPTWTTVTSYVRGITTHRGRSDDFGSFDTGTAQVILDNRTRLFDPFYTSGTYYGKLLPRKQIRIRATSGATTYDVWRGFITGWPVTYTEGGLDSTVTLQCFDALGLLAAETVSDDYYQYYLYDTYAPYRYWKCDDVNSSTTIIEKVSGLNLAQTGALPFQSQAPLTQGLAGTGAQILAYATTAITKTAPTGLNFSLVAMPTVANDTGNTITYATGQKALKISIGAANGSCTIEYTDVANKWTTTIAAGNFNPNIPHHFYFHTTYDGGNRYIWIDGVNVSSWTGAAITPAGTTESLTISNMVVSEIFVKEFGHSIAPNYEGTTYSNLAQGFYLVTTYIRILKLLDQTSFDNWTYCTGYPVVTADGAINAYKIENLIELIPQLRTVLATEAGEMFVRKDGMLMFCDRNYKYRNTKSTTVQAAFSDAGGATLKYGKELTLDYDADNIRNSVTVNFSSGAQNAINNYTAVNTTSTASVGKASDTIDTYLQNLTDATTLADLQLGVGAALKPRVSPLEVGVTSQTADWQTLLGLELLERITVTRTPSTGNAITQTMLINSIDHTIRPGVWETTITGSTRYTGWFTLDVSALDGTDILV